MTIQLSEMHGTLGVKLKMQKIKKIKKKNAHMKQSFL